MIVSSSVRVSDSSLVLALGPRPVPGLGTENGVPAPAPRINVGRVGLVQNERGSYGPTRTSIFGLVGRFDAGRGRRRGDLYIISTNGRNKNNKDKDFQRRTKEKENTYLSKSLSFKKTSSRLSVSPQRTQ